ncbi:type II toxin-antitoxin system RelE family toxin [Methylobacterium sp. E-025]|uniref:type II toxin-antitoxin system RelE family toxin n=1 Tax=Methylobacterium sp. E-025 TaxID=2836561 RepID=UPI00391DA301
MAKLPRGLAVGPAAASFLDAMQPGKVRTQIVRKMRALQEDPRPPGCKKLAGVSSKSDSVWRVRSGNYRMLYVVHEAEVIVIDIGHRKNIYK